MQGSPRRFEESLLGASEVRLMDYLNSVDWGLPLTMIVGATAGSTACFRKIHQWKREHPSSRPLVTPKERLKSVFIGTIVVTLLMMVCFWICSFFSHVDAAMVWTNPWDWVLSLITGLLWCGDWMLYYACKRIDKLKSQQENQTSLNDPNNSNSLKDTQPQQSK